MAVTDKIYVQNHHQLASQLDTSFARGAFSGATLDRLFTGDWDSLDDASRDRVQAFAEDFLDCDCDANPYCRHPERKFVRYLLELRAEGFGPDAIVDHMSAEYGLYAYSGDILSFLDSSVRTLEAAESLADVEGHDGSRRDIKAARENLL